MNAETRDFALHRASTLVEKDPKEAYRLLLAAMGRRLDSGTRRESNALLRKAGLDGNGRFRKVGEALTVAFDTLARVGIEPDETLNAHKFSGESGFRTIDLAFSNPEDSFNPESITNSTLAFSWTELRDGVFEAVAYLS